MVKEFWKQHKTKIQYNRTLSKIVMMMDALQDPVHIMTWSTVLSKVNPKLNVFNFLVRLYRDFMSQSVQHQQHLTSAQVFMILMKNHRIKPYQKNKLVSILIYLDGQNPSPSKTLTKIKMWLNYLDQVLIKYSHL